MTDTMAGSETERRQRPKLARVTTDEKAATWKRLAPHIHHQIDSYGQWTKAGLGRATGPYIPTEDVESMTQGGACQIVTPDEAIDLAERLGPRGELHLNPLLAGIDPDASWEMLRTFERYVLPHLGSSSGAPLPSGS